MVRGVVERVNWKKGENWTDLSVDVQLVGGPIVEAIYLTDWPPPPRSVVMVDTSGPGAWVVLGVEGGVRNLFHDDFMGGNATTFGDTTWEESGSGTNGFTAGTGMGVARLTGTIGQVHAWSKPGRFGWAQDMPFLITARVRANSITTGTVSVGIADDPTLAAVNDGMWVTGGLGNTNWEVRGNLSGGAVADVDTPAEAEADTWVVLELLVQCGIIAACWIDGHGPTMLAQPISTSVENQTPFIQIDASAGTLSGFVDFYRLDRPGSLVTPAEASPATVESDAAVEFSADDTDLIVAVTDDDAVETDDDPNDAAAGDAT